MSWFLTWYQSKSGIHLKEFSAPFSRENSIFSSTFSFTFWFSFCQFFLFRYSIFFQFPLLSLTVSNIRFLFLDNSCSISISQVLLFMISSFNFNFLWFLCFITVFAFCESHCSWFCSQVGLILFSPFFPKILGFREFVIWFLLLLRSRLCFHCISLQFAIPLQFSIRFRSDRLWFDLDLVSPMSVCCLNDIFVSFLSIDYWYFLFRFHLIVSFDLFQFPQFLGFQFCFNFLFELDTRSSFYNSSSNHWFQFLMVEESQIWDMNMKFIEFDWSVCLTLLLVWDYLMNFSSHYNLHQFMKRYWSKDILLKQLFMCQVVVCHENWYYISLHWYGILAVCRMSYVLYWIILWCKLDFVCGAVGFMQCLCLFCFQSSCRTLKIPSSPQTHESFSTKIISGCHNQIF